MPANIVDITGQTFGRLTVIRLLGTRPHSGTVWECLCCCGNTHTALGSNLRNGNVKSCGCINYKHGHCVQGKSLTYSTYGAMISRCYNKNDPKFESYGGRDIKVCDRWLGENGFANFVQDMGERPGKKYSIDRIDGNGNYEPDNCRWATVTEQQRNLKNNRYITAFGETLLIRAWAEKTGILETRIRHRLESGWTPESALTVPRQHNGGSGEKHGMAKLSEQQAKEILLATGTHGFIAKMYGVSRALVGLIKAGKIWKHLQENK